jgi:hypothetical protein
VLAGQHQWTVDAVGPWRYALAGWGRAGSS